MKDNYRRICFDARVQDVESFHAYAKKGGYDYLELFSFLFRYQAYKNYHYSTRRPYQLYEWIGRADESGDGF